MRIFYRKNNLLFYVLSFGPNKAKYYQAVKSFTSKYRHLGSSTTNNQSKLAQRRAKFFKLWCKYFTLAIYKFTITDLQIYKITILILFLFCVRDIWKIIEKSFQRISTQWKIQEIKSESLLSARAKDTPKTKASGKQADKEKKLSDSSDSE